MRQANLSSLAPPPIWPPTSAWSWHCCLFQAKRQRRNELLVDGMALADACFFELYDAEVDTIRHAVERLDDYLVSSARDGAGGVVATEAAEHAKAERQRGCLALELEERLQSQSAMRAIHSTTRAQGTWQPPDAPLTGDSRASSAGTTRLILPPPPPQAPPPPQLAHLTQAPQLTQNATTVTATEAATASTATATPAAAAVAATRISYPAAAIGEAQGEAPEEERAEGGGCSQRGGVSDVS